MVVLSHRPAELNVSLGSGICQVWDKESGDQQQPDGRGKRVHNPWRHRTIPDVG
jgi:hypothetical protein